MTSYSSIPRRYDKAKAYLYFKEPISNSFEPKKARRNDDTTRVLLLASLDNSYVEGCAQNLHFCGQTVRNRLKQQNPQRLLQVNQQTIQEMKNKGALSKPLTLAVDWHDIMYYGDPKSRRRSRNPTQERFKPCLQVRHRKRSSQQRKSNLSGDADAQ